MGQTSTAEHLPVGGPADRERGELKDYHPDKLSRAAVVAIQLHATGMKNKDIAERLGKSEGWVSITINDPRAKALIKQFAGRVAEMVEDVHVKLQLLAPEALDTVVQTMRHTEDEKLASQNALALLDRAGYGKIEKRVTLGGKLTDDQVERLESSLSESAQVVQEVAYEAEVEDEDERSEGEQPEAEVE